MKGLVIMYSGGLDSFIAEHYARSQGYTPTLVYVNLGHPYAPREVEALPPHILQIDFKVYPHIANRLKNQIIPSRNMLLATVGGMFGDRVWLCALDGEQKGKERDKSDAFFNASTRILSFLNNFFQPRTTVESPFRHMSKAETIAWAIQNGLTPAQLLATRSCYAETEKPCGTCLTCVKRHMAFALNGIDDGLREKVMRSQYFHELCLTIPLAVLQGDYSRYTPKRVNEFEQFLDICNA